MDLQGLLASAQARAVEEGAGEAVQTLSGARQCAGPQSESIVVGSCLTAIAALRRERAGGRRKLEFEQKVAEAAQDGGASGKIR